MTLEKEHAEVREEVRYLRSPHMPHIEVLAVRNSRVKWRAFHERYVVCAVASSASDWIYRGQAGRVRDGSTLFIEPGETHATTVLRKPVSFKALFIEPEWLSQAASELGIGNAPHFPEAQVQDPRLFAQLCCLVEAIEKQWDVLEQQGMLAECLYSILLFSERRPRSTPRRSGIEKAMEVLRERFAENLPLAELAAAAGLSRFHFVRAFRNRTGIPPHAYQVRVRIEKARALLNCGMRATDVASIVGFSDQSHFSRHFRRVLGVTPSGYALGRKTASRKDGAPICSTG